MNTVTKRGNNMSYEDEIYHSGYLDGYYDSMELYHSDDETREERAKRRARRKFGRTVALGVGTTAGVAALGVGIAAADKRHSDKVHQRRQDELNSYYQRLKNTADNLKSRMGPFRKKRNIHGFRKSAGSYKVPLNDGDFGSYMKLNRIRRERLNY